MDDIEDGDDDETDEDCPPEPGECHHGREDATCLKLVAEVEIGPDTLFEVVDGNVVTWVDASS